jgi:hypothetical protein
MIMMLGFWWWVLGGQHNMVWRNAECGRPTRTRAGQEDERPGAGDEEEEDRTQEEDEQDDIFCVDWGLVLNIARSKSILSRMVSCDDEDFSAAGDFFLISCSRRIRHSPFHFHFEKYFIIIAEYLHPLEGRNPCLNYLAVSPFGTHSSNLHPEVKRNQNEYCT